MNVQTENNTVEAYITRIGWDFNLPVYAVKAESWDRHSTGIAYHVYLGTELVCSMHLENLKWTARDGRTGKKISARKGAWWNAASFAVKKYTERIGWEACQKIKSDVRAMGEDNREPKNLMVPRPGCHM